MNACRETPGHNSRISPALKSADGTKSAAGELSGRLVTTVEPGKNGNLNRQQQDRLQQLAPSPVQPGDKTTNSREILHRRFNTFESAEHFASFCSMVEDIYVQTLFHCTIDRLPATDMTKFILEEYNALEDMVAMTAGFAAHESLANEPGQHPGAKGQATGPVETSIKERLRVLYPWYSDNNLCRLFNYLDKDCQQINGCPLSDLSDVELLSFSKYQFNARAKLHQGSTRRRLGKERLSEEDIVLLFSSYLPQPPKQRRPARRLTTPGRLYRLGAFTSNDDEMGRIKHCKLGQLIFDRNQVNFKSARFGPGLYSAQSATDCWRYRKKSYNLNKPLAILEMITAKDTDLVDYHSTPRQTEQQPPPADNSNQPKTIVKTTPGECLIKDPRCIINARAFHPSMMTKIHIPYSTEEILTHRLQQKLISDEDFALLDHVRTIHRRPIADTLGLESGIRDVLECQVSILPEWGSMRGLASSKCYEIKFYTQSLVSSDLLRIKPAAPLNRWQKTTAPETACNHDIMMDYDFMEFHVQYHRLKRAGTGEDIFESCP